MFKWSVPLWRRWHWHRWRRAYIAQTPRGDRRAWVRYPCNMETACLTEADLAGCAATVRNISLGGMSLIVERPFASGTLLKVEVHSALENTPQMLCVRVIHVAPQPDNTWSLGCAFARELSDHTLRAFRSARVLPLPPLRSIWARIGSGLMTCCRRTKPVDQAPSSAKILNVSSAGVGLMVPRRFELGMPVSLELPIGNEDEPVAVRAHVVHSKPHRNGDWLIGCAFEQQLTADQVRALA
jgi:hypothetical protein